MYREHPVQVKSLLSSQSCAWPGLDPGVSKRKESHTGFVLKNLSSSKEGGVQCKGKGDTVNGGGRG